MKRFISEIEKIPAEELIYKLSEMSIQMHNKEVFAETFGVQINKKGYCQKKSIVLPAWDIPSIEYLAIKNSTDYRDSNKNLTIPELVNLYREYENELNSKQIKEISNLYTLPRMILGMTAEQFQFQKFHLIVEKLNRTYYILIKAKHYEHSGEINVSDAIQEVFGFSAEDYLAVLGLVFWLCTKRPDPLNVPEELYRRKETTIFTKENISKFVEYYSCTYDDLRKSPIQRQLLYAKPFIKTTRNNLYLSSSVYMVKFLIGNGLYWLGRDYYKQDGQRFPNAFGNLFEDYIKELCSIYCGKDEWHTIPKENKKNADYVLTFDLLQILIESKSSLLNLDAKQQVPNLESTNNFFAKTIQESYEQLNSSYSVYKDNVKTPTIKVILLYDEFSNTIFIEQSMPEIFKNDSLCFVMTIRQLEILLYLHKNDSEKFDTILGKIIAATTPEAGTIDLSAAFENLCIYGNPHIDTKLNYSNRMLQHFTANYCNDKELERV